GGGDEFAVAHEDVFHAVEVAVLVFNEGLELRLIKGAAAAATEDDGLVAALIDDAVAIEAAADGERGAAGLVGGDQLGRGGRAEALVAGHVFRGDHLHDAQAVFAVGDEGEHGGVDGTDLHGAGVVERAVGV